MREKLSLNDSGYFTESCYKVDTGKQVLWVLKHVAETVLAFVHKQKGSHKKQPNRVLNALYLDTLEMSVEQNYFMVDNISSWFFLKQLNVKYRHRNWVFIENVIVEWLGDAGFIDNLAISLLLRIITSNMVSGVKLTFGISIICKD